MTPLEIATAVRRHWWLFLVRGLAALAFGVLTLLWPGATLIVLVAFIAAYALVDGTVAVVHAFRLRPLHRWWLLLLYGLISLTFGVLTVVWPSLSLVYVVVSVSLWMLFASVAHFTLARIQKAMGVAPVWSILAGILSLALAVGAIVFPGLTVLTVIALIAWVALLLGALQLVVAFRLRRWVTTVAAPAPA